MSIKNDIDSVTFYVCSTSWLEAVFCYSFFQAEDGIRDRSPSRGLGDVYKRQGLISAE